jgi:hypothetical protein
MRAHSTPRSRFTVQNGAVSRWALTASARAVASRLRPCASRAVPCHACRWPSTGGVSALTERNPIPERSMTGSTTTMGTAAAALHMAQTARLSSDRPDIRRQSGRFVSLVLSTALAPVPVQCVWHRVRVRVCAGIGARGAVSGCLRSRSIAL